MVLFHTAVSLLGAALTVILSYLLFRKKAVSAWGWIASFLPDSPVFLLAPLGTTNLENILLLSHTIGILLFAVVLVIIDILLLEIALLRYVSWLPFPQYMRTLKRIGRIVEKLEKYNAIPRPVRIQRVFTVTILAGVIHLALNIALGSL